MRLCYLASASNVHTQQWALAMSERGHEVFVLSLDQCLIPGARVIPLRPQRPSKVSYVLAIPNVRRLVREIGPDVLHSHYATGYGFLGAMAGWHPFVLSVWGTDAYQFPRISPLHRRSFQWILRRADRICCTSRALASEVTRYVHEPITITPFGVDLKKFAPNHRSSARNEFVFGTVKGLDQSYGIDVLIRAFALAKSLYKGPRQLRLIIAGKGPHGRQFRELATSLRVSDSIEMLGFVPHDDVPATLAKFDAFMCLSIVPESFGVAMIEACACGLPVVVSAVPGLLENITDGITGLVVTRNDHWDAARAMVQLVENPGIGGRIGAAARQFVSAKYGWAACSNAMQSVYQELLVSRVRDCESGVTGAAISRRHVEPPS